MYSYFRFRDAFLVTIQVLKQNIKNLMILFFINACLLTSTYVVIWINSKKWAGGPISILGLSQYKIQNLTGGWFIPFIILTGLSILISNVYLISLVQTELFGQIRNVKSILTGLLKYIGGLFLNGLIIAVIYYCLVIINNLTYGFGIVVTFGALIYLIYFTGYYRFIPYYAVIQSSISFPRVKELLSGKFCGSLGVWFIFSLIIVSVLLLPNHFLTQIYYKVTTNRYTALSFIVFIIFQLIILFTGFLQVLTNASIISSAIQSKAKGDKITKTILDSND